MFHEATIVALALLSSASVPTAQDPGGSNVHAALMNGGFEEGALGERPPGWDVSRVDAEATEEGAFEGRACARLSFDVGGGGLTQFVDATALRGKRVEVRAHLRGDRSRLGVLVWHDREFDSFDGPPVQSEGWQEVRAEASVHSDAEYLTISVDYGGTEPAWVDAVSITVLGEAPASRTVALPVVAAVALVGAVLLVLLVRKRGRAHGAAGSSGR